MIYDVQINYQIDAENIEEARDAVLYGEDKPISKTVYEVREQNKSIMDAIIWEENHGK